MKIRFSQQSRGFSLVEMMVSLMIFSVVAVVALGAMIKIINVNKKAQTLQSSITNLNFALDVMSRELTVALAVYCQGGSPETFTSFTPQTGDPTAASNWYISPCQIDNNSANSAMIVFKTPTLDPTLTCVLSSAYLFRYNPSSHFTTLEKAEQTACGQVLGSTDAPFVSVVSPNVTLTNYSLSVNYDGTLGSPTYQRHPLVSWYIAGYAGVRETEKTYFNVQTSVAESKLQP